MSLLVAGALVLARNRLGSTPSPPALAPWEGDTLPAFKEWIVAFVWPKRHATAEELKALGHELAAWQPHHPFVTRIVGLEELLEGK